MLSVICVSTARASATRWRSGSSTGELLTLTLRGLERDGLVTRSVFPTIPPRVDYALTDLGRSLRQPVKALGLWAFEHHATIERARKAYDQAQD